MIQVHGKPGSGKSVLLKHLARSRQEHGHILVLKWDRLSGNGWSGYATFLGLDNFRLNELLYELSVSGMPTLFIDGIDRVVLREHRNIVKDVIDTILSTDKLTHWGIVVTTRDNNIEYLRTWLPESVLTNNRFSELCVDELDDSDLSELALRVPSLKSFLSNSSIPRDVKRRPFFLRALVSIGSETVSDGQLYTTESDLALKWWNQAGGFDSISRDEIRLRKDILSRIATIAISTEQRIICTTGLDQTIIQALIDDDILVAPGLNSDVKFSHDIFFEWSLFSILNGQNGEWLAFIVDAGEPNYVGRIVELMSIYHFTHDLDWVNTLEQLESKQLRTQWYRTWLLSPLTTIAFDKKCDVFDKCVLPYSERLNSCLMWFQAIYSFENPIVLSGNSGLKHPTNRNNILEYADRFAWPSDMFVWVRFLKLLIARMDRIGHDHFPVLLELFRVWCNAFNDSNHIISVKVILIVHEWLKKAELQKFSNDRWNTTTEGNLSFKGIDVETFAIECRTFLLGHGQNHQNVITDYIDWLLSRKDIADDVVSNLIDWSSIIVNKCASKFVDLLLQVLKQALPNEKAAKNRGSLFGYTIHITDWDAPSIDNFRLKIFTSAPICEPYKALFSDAPDEGIRLVQELCNHSMTAWCQQHKYTHDTMLHTPIPIVMEFPWGKQEFWGDWRVYLWYRGHFTVGIIGSGLMALEKWALDQVDTGAVIDNVIQRVVKSNNCVAILGILCTLALHKSAVSRTTLPLVCCQRLWQYDARRHREDLGSLNANLIMSPLDDRSDEYRRSVAELNKLPVRGIDIRSLCIGFVYSGDAVLRSEFVQRVTAFPENLPYEFVEEENDTHFKEELFSQAKRWVQFADNSNYSVTKVEQDKNLVEIQYNPPEQSPADAAKYVAATTYLNDANVISTVSIALRTGNTYDQEKFQDLLKHAKLRDHDELFNIPRQDHDSPESQRAGSVAAVAALVLCQHSIQVDGAVEWAINVMKRVSTIKYSYGPFGYEGTIEPFHPLTFACDGLSGWIRFHGGGQFAKESLLRLMLVPNHDISTKALRSALTCCTVDERFAKIALQLCLELCCEFLHGYSKADQQKSLKKNTSRRISALKNAITLLKKNRGNIEYPTMPAAWRIVKIKDDNDRAIERRVEPSLLFRWDLGAKVLDVLYSHELEEFIAWKVLGSESFRIVLCGFLDWTIKRLTPHRGYRDDMNENDTPYDWTTNLMMFLSLYSSKIPSNVVQKSFIGPILGCNPDVKGELLSVFVGLYVPSAVCDPPNVKDNAIDDIMVCIKSVVPISFSEQTCEDRRVYLEQETFNIIRDAFAVKIQEGKFKSARFYNDDWSDIEILMPIIDYVMENAGHFDNVLELFLKLVESAQTYYPLGKFLEQLLSINESIWQCRSVWTSTRNGARIASLIQVLVERNGRPNSEYRKKINKLIDHLIDVGNRRAAAMQRNEMYGRA